MLQIITYLLQMEFELAVFRLFSYLCTWKYFKIEL